MRRTLCAVVLMYSPCRARSAIHRAPQLVTTSQTTLVTVLFFDSATPFLQFLMLCQQGIVDRRVILEKFLIQNGYLSPENSREVLSLFCMGI
jgi:hypothetical protein